jgi:CyaY protein
MLDEQTFQRRADEALAGLHLALAKASDQFGFDADFRAGALVIEFEDPPAKFVVSPNSPVRQLWVSAHSKSFKLDWDEAAGAFLLPPTGESLHELIAGAISRQLGEEVTL